MNIKVKPSQNISTSGPLKKRIASYTRRIDSVEFNTSGKEQYRNSLVRHQEYDYSSVDFDGAEDKVKVPLRTAVPGTEAITPRPLLPSGIWKSEFVQTGSMQCLWERSQGASQDLVKFYTLDQTDPQQPQLQIVELQKDDEGIKGSWQIDTTGQTSQSALQPEQAESYWNLYSESPFS